MWKIINVSDYYYVIPTVLQQVLNRMGFIQDFRIERIIEGNSVPVLKASWRLRYPACFSQLTITFRDEFNIFIARKNILGTAILTTTEITQSFFLCNGHVKATFIGTDFTYSLTANSDGTVYTGGKM